MGKLGKITLIMAVAITVLSGFSGCKAEPQTELTPAKKACIEIMQQVPVYYEDFEFWDVRSLRDDIDLSDMYQVWYERKVDSLEERYGLNSSGIDYLAQGELLDIIKADYDMQALRDRIAVDFYRDTSYEDMEVWKSEPSSDPQSVTGGWVLAEGLLIKGANNSNVDDYLCVVSGEELSMYDKNAAEVLERLPEGIMTRISRSNYPEGLILSGSSINKEEENVLKWTNVYKFESPDDVQSADAEEYFKDIEDEFKEAESIFAENDQVSLFNTFTIQRDGEFVTWSMLIDEKYMIALLFYG
jgi:hypothetical protein